MENEVIEIKTKNMFAAICITQAICISVILAGVLIIKFFFNDNFVRLQSWCTNNVLEQTKITEFLPEEKISEI